MTTIETNIPTDSQITQEQNYVSQFDFETYVVIDRATRAEVCICNEFEESVNPARQRAEAIAFCLNYIGFDILTDGIPDAFKGA